MAPWLVSLATAMAQKKAQAGAQHPDGVQPNAMGTSTAAYEALMQRAAADDAKGKDMLGMPYPLAKWDPAFKFEKKVFG